MTFVPNIVVSEKDIAQHNTVKKLEDREPESQNSG